MVARRGKDASLFSGCAAGSWLFTSRIAAGREFSLPQSRPMPSIGPRCHELRIVDERVSWRIVHRIDPDAIVILEVFEKKTNRTPVQVIEICQRRLKNYES